MRKVLQVLLQEGSPQRIRGSRPIPASLIRLPDINMLDYIKVRCSLE